MSEYFKVKDLTHWNPSPGVKIIKAHDYALLSDVNTLLDKVHVSVAEASEKAKEVYKQRYKEGYEVGLEEGKGVYTDKLMDMVMSQVDSIEGLEQQLVKVVFDAVTKVVGSFDQSDLITRLVHQGLNAVRGSKSIILRVHPNDERVLRVSLENFLVSRDNQRGYITLIADPNLNEGDCVLETEQGVVDASLNSQLAILRRSLENHVKRK
ncbi:MAG: HrpE/YscL family type III secretion apparatus protein [Succinivibrio sp.]|nr:HrpE/YscL family type III secretion apparatus protein [Succinivibrio sp.]